MVKSNVIQFRPKPSPSVALETKIEQLTTFIEEMVDRKPGEKIPTIKEMRTRYEEAFPEADLVFYHGSTHRMYLTFGKKTVYVDLPWGNHCYRPFDLTCQDIRKQLMKGKE